MLICCFQEVICAWIVSSLQFYLPASSDPDISIPFSCKHCVCRPENQQWAPVSLCLRAFSDFWSPIHPCTCVQARSIGTYPLLSQSSTSDWWTSVFRHLRYLTSWWDDCQCVFDTGSYEFPAGWSSNWWHTVDWFHRLIFFRFHTSTSALWVHLANKSLALKNLFLGLLMWESKIRHLKTYRFMSLYPKDL